MEYSLHRDCLYLKKRYTLKDRTLLDSGYYDTETWGGLCKFWKGYKIAEAGCDAAYMAYSAKCVRKLARQLGTPVIDFQRFGLVGRFVEQERDSENEYSP